MVVPATYRGFLYCGSISNKAGAPPLRRGRDGEQELGHGGGDRAESRLGVDILPRDRAGIGKCPAVGWDAEGERERDKVRSPP